MAIRKQYRRIYFGALTFIALLIAMALVVIDSIASEESTMSEFNEIGSRQRMLSERIVHLTLEFAVETNGEARNSIAELIENALQLFDKTHQLLIRGHLPGGQIVRFEENIDDLFFGEPEGLDSKTRIFIYNTREVLAHKWTPDFASGYYLKQLRKSTIRDLHRGLELLAAQFSRNSHDRIIRMRIIVAILLGGIIFILICTAVFIFNPLFEKITAQEQKLKKLAFIDPLTNCHNRRSFIASAESEFDRSRRYKNTFSILFFDVDLFKDINDSYGHAAGDIALIEITNACQKNIRDSDFLGRIGGDEFGVVLHECTLEDAEHTAEKLRNSVDNLLLSGDFGTFDVSISIGVAMLIDEDQTVFDTLNRADKNLYSAKREGRNLVVAV